MDAAYWDDVYGALGARGVSWAREGVGPSLDLLEPASATVGSAIDMGGGASPLAGALLSLGVDDVTVLDISATALRAAQASLGDRTDDVEWITADLRSWQPGRRWDLWHDRAMFHFMVTEGDRRAYRRALAASLAPGGLVIVAAFAPDGPEQCSRLPVRRYGAGELVDALGDDLVLLEELREVHMTPAGTPQPFTWVLARREG
ncbi:MAG: class I SAM-dependent methyltransferase [Actinobacteria bacterium]|nr:class I SAM-dependent methyltransferase [Actinomycetota bacterium]